MKTALTGFPPRLSGFAATAPGSGVTYDPTTSGLTATEMQAAIDELVTMLGAAVSYATPAIVLGMAAAAGAATTVIRSDATIVAFDVTAPTTQAFGDAAVTGSAAVAARRDHKHAMPANPVTAAAVSAAVALHAHVDNVVFSGDGSTTAFVLPVAPVDATSVAVYVTAARSQDWTLSGALLDTITFGSAPPSAANNIVIDITAALV